MRVGAPDLGCMGALAYPSVLESPSPYIANKKCYMILEMMFYRDTWHHSTLFSG